MYSKINTWTVKGMGKILMKKRHFLDCFRPVWQTAFTKKNIQQAFKKPGIWPINPALVLNVITRLITPPQALEAPPISSPVLKTRPGDDS